MKSKEKIPRRLFLLTAFFLTCLLFYWQFGLLPGDLKRYALKKVQSLTGKKVTFDRVVALPFYGVRFDRLRVEDADGKPIFSCQRLRLNAKLGTFFLEKKIIVNRFEIDSPVLDWRLAPHKNALVPTPVTQLSGQIPIPVLPHGPVASLEGLENGPDILLPENVYVQEIWIRDGRLTFRQDENTPPIETLYDIHLQANFEGPPVLVLKGSLTLGERPYAKINVHGVYDLSNSKYEFNAKVSSDKIPSWLAQIQSGRLLVLRKAQARFEATIKSIDETQIFFKTQAALHEAELAAGPTVFYGTLWLEAKGLYRLNEKKFERYKGHIKFDQVRAIHPAPTIDALENLSGDLSFEPDSLDFSSIQGQYQTVPFTAQGHIQSFQTFDLNGRIQIQAKLETMLALFGQQAFSLPKDIRISGDCTTVTAMTGSLKKPAGLQTTHQVSLENVALKTTDGLFDWTQGSAKIRLDGEGVTADDITFLAKKLPVRANLFIPKQPGAKGLLKFTSDRFNFNSQAIFSSDEILFDQARINYDGLSGSLSGALSNLSDPQVRAQGSVRINLERTSAWLSSLGPVWKDLKLRGGVAGELRIAGPLRSPIDWDLQASLEGGPVWVGPTYQVDTLAAQVQMKNRRIYLPQIETRLYGGSLNANATIDASQPSAIFTIQASANKLALSSLGKTLTPPRSDLVGSLTMQSSLQGQWGQPASYHGQGVIGIANGNFWRTSLFKKMGQLPLVRVEGLEEVVFRRLYGNFVIRDERLWSQDLALSSDTVNLFLQGSVGFKQDLDFLMSIEYTDSVFQGAEDAGGLARFMVRQAADFIPQYKVTGTLQNPQNEKLSASQAGLVEKKLFSLLRAVTR